MEKIRLQKYLAEQGIASRRKSEELIRLGHVVVNGRVVREMGTCIDPQKDKVFFDHKRIIRQQKQVKTLVLHKPRGYACTTGKEQGKTVFELLPGWAKKMFLVGRLDKKSEGLLLLSDDGDLVNRLTHPRFELEKIYHVVVSGDLTEQVLKRLNESMEIEGYWIKPAQVRFIRNGGKPHLFVLEFILKEGRNRQIRQMCEKMNLQVHRLVRVQIKGLTLENLKLGDWRELSSREIYDLKGAE
ncbi:MAG: rRNA pseudouridine synthase [Candidatus Aureabacteria bacterium]|nr:rRNA pseudouridine synthase [Candidatus Auribacterota bacterium]